MINACTIGIGTEFIKIVLILLSFSVSGFLLFILKKFNISTRSKVLIIYSHIISLLFPFVLLTTNIGCGAICASCYNNMFHLLSLVIPSTLMVGTVTGFLVIPTVFVYTNRHKELKSGKVHRFVNNSSKKLNIKKPKIYILNKATPQAFSFRNFRSAIFLSVGLFDILKLKEIQAIILHELAHIKEKSSVLKMSTFFLRIFSPFSLLLKFHHSDREEERKADMLAIKIQGTNKYIKSARKKIMKYESTF